MISGEIWLLLLNLIYQLINLKQPFELFGGNLCNLGEIDFLYLKLNQQVNDILEILALCISHGFTTLAVSSSQLSVNLTAFYHSGIFFKLFSIKWLFLIKKSYQVLLYELEVIKWLFLIEVIKLFITLM